MFLHVPRFGCLDLKRLGEIPLPLACPLEVRYPHAKGVSQRYVRFSPGRYRKKDARPPLRYYLEKVLRHMGVYLGLGS